MEARVKNHFKKQDPLLFALLQKYEPGLAKLVPRDQKQFFISLCDEIISQQLSGKAANVIFARFEKLFAEKKITPGKVLKIEEGVLRATGMSWSKAKFIKDLAAKVKSGELQLEKLVQMSDEEVIEELTKVKGIGKWTAGMFLMFTLGREDVFSAGDLGLKNAIKKIYAVENITQERLENLTAKWKPYRTYAARILWKSLGNR